MAMAMLCQIKRGFTIPFENHLYSTLLVRENTNTDIMIFDTYYNRT